MNLRQLESFVAVADELHFGRAAQRTHLSQPALTQRIQRLEVELGFALFSRNRRRVVLTPAGAVLLGPSRRLLADADDMLVHAAIVAAGRAGSLRVGYVGSALYTVIPAVMNSLRDNVPNLDVALVEYKTAPQLDLLARGLLDAGFIHRPADAVEDLAVLDLGTEPRMVALARTHRLATRRRIRLDDLADDAFILSPRELDADAHDQIVDACARHGFSPHVTQEASNLQSTIGLVAAGLGVAFVAESITRATRRAGVVFRPLTPPPLLLHTTLAWPADHPSTALPELVNATRAWLVTSTALKPGRRG